RAGTGEPLYTGQPARRGMAGLRQRLPGRHEARRHTAGGFHPRPPAPGNAAPLRPL
ncbi:RHS Repeat family protein, partial [Shigella dysenteriae]